MTPKVFTTEELQQIFADKIRHAAYDETVEMAEEIRIHSDGKFPEKLISVRRPSESQKVFDYRKEIWVPITKVDFGRVVTSLQKIRRSSGWSVRYDEAKVPAGIREGERLSDYLEKNFPYFNNLTFWAFTVLLPFYCAEANGLVCIYPLEEDVASNGYVRPFPYTYTAEQVIDYAEDQYAVVKLADSITYMENKTEKTGHAFYIFTTLTVERWHQSSSKGEYTKVWEYIHNFNELPVVKTKGRYKKMQGDTFVYESRLSDMIIRFNEAVREYSDLQAEVVQNIFSERWEYNQDDCEDCKGKGKVPSAGFRSEMIECDTCHGTGARPRGPYSTLYVKQPMAGEAAAPTPPIGYVQKQIDIAKLQDERIDNHIRKGLAAVNMEFLAQVPLATSGVSKSMDRDEGNNTANAVCEDVVSVMDKVAYFFGEYRYRVVLPDKNKRKEMLPVINVPESFDFISSAVIEQELANAKNNKVNPVIITAMEVEYAAKKFSADPEIKNRLALTLQLDPLAGVSEEDKMVRLSNRGITQETYIISCNVREFIDRAVDEKGNAFFTMEPKDQKALLKSYAQQQEIEDSAEAAVLSDQPAETAKPGDPATKDEVTQ